MYVFEGFDINNSNANGISTTDMGGTITIGGAGSMTIAQDINDQGTGTVTKSSGVFTYPALDTLGRSVATMNGVSYAFYVVNAGHIKFLENDGTNFVQAGSAFTQGTSLPSMNVFTLAGVDGSGAGGLGNGLVVAGGAFTASGSALSLGIIDFNDNGAAPVLGTAFTGTFTAPTSGRGTLTLTGAPTGISQFAYYPTANNGVLLLELDTGLATIGAALPQAGSITTANLSGNYATNFTDGTAGLGYMEEDAVGLVMADGQSMFTGTIDLFNTRGNLYLGAPLTGTFAASGNAGQGRFTGSFSITLNETNTQTQNEIFYVAGTDIVLFIESDRQAQTSGVMQIQNLTP